MSFVKFSQFNNTSAKDANKLAPSSCSAKNEMNIIDFTDIAVAVSVLLYIVINIINVISIITVINIISAIIILITGIIIISKLFKKKQPVFLLN